MKSAIPFLAAAALACSASGPLFAANSDAPQVSVRYTDLDLSTSEGRAALETRIQVAARNLCGLDETPATGTRIASPSRRACYEKATSQIGESIARAAEKRESKG